jgi:hypothetical protein
MYAIFLGALKILYIKQMVSTIWDLFWVKRPDDDVAAEGGEVEGDFNS